MDLPRTPHNQVSEWVSDCFKHLMSHLSTISWQEWVLFQWDVDDDDVCFVQKKPCWIRVL